ncbi:MAG: hypothetical protein AAF360_12380 [Pseudomonadota bacterium]
MNVLIATPTAGGTVTTAYAQTLTAATRAITAAGGDYRLATVDGADVVISRNLLAHYMLADPTATHVLFIDGDMSVEEAVIRRFLTLDAPIVGAAYPERRMDLSAFHDAMTEQTDEPRARALASSYTVRMSPGRKRVRDNLIEVDGLGFGCVLIRRAVFDALVDRKIVSPFVSAKLRAGGFKTTIWDFFDEIQQDDGDWLSEDFSFCDRVRRLGDTPIIAYVGDGVGHIGAFNFNGPYVERLKAGKI